MDFEQALARLQRRSEAYGVKVLERGLDPETPAVFDGPTITLNTGTDVQSRCYYLVHSLGSIVEWSVRPADSRAVYDELRRSKAVKGRDPARFEAALAGFLAFEEVASEYAVWILPETGNSELVQPYTTFARADADAMVRFHREGVAPVWRDFFPAWQAQAARGERKVHPYRPRAVPPFVPVRIEPQEVVQEVDGDP
jgi:hypothetical protein